VSESGQNSIVVVLGANESLRPTDVRAATELIKQAKILLCQLEIHQDSILEAFKIAKQHGVKIIFNPAPGLPDISRELIKLADIICPNENEAEFLTGMSLNTIEDAKQIAMKIASMTSTASIVIITLGEKGCVFKSPHDASPQHVPCEVVRAVDTTGAGDSFVGSLAYFLSTRPELSTFECVRRSLRIASVSVQYAGTQTSYLPKNQLPTDLFL